MESMGRALGQRSEVFYPDSVVLVGSYCGQFKRGWLLRLLYLPLVSREWKNGSNTSYKCTPFPHSLLTKGRYKAVARSPLNQLSDLSRTMGPGQPQPSAQRENR